MTISPIWPLIPAIHTWYRMTTMIEAGLDISKIITHRFDITDYQKGFDAMLSGNSGKVILDWTNIDKVEQL